MYWERSLADWTMMCTSWKIQTQCVISKQLYRWTICALITFERRAGNDWRFHRGYKWNRFRNSWKAKRVIQPWANQELVEKCEKRRKLDRMKKEFDESRQLYTQANNDVKAEAIAAEEERINKRCCDILEGSEKNDTRKHLIVSRNFPPRTQARPALNKNGTLLTNKKIYRSDGPSMLVTCITTR